MKMTTVSDVDFAVDGYRAAVTSASSTAIERGKARREMIETIRADERARLEARVAELTAALRAFAGRHEYHKDWEIGADPRIEAAACELAYHHGMLSRDIWTDGRDDAIKSMTGAWRKDWRFWAKKALQAADQARAVEWSRP